MIELKLLLSSVKQILDNKPTQRQLFDIHLIRNITSYHLSFTDAVRAYFFEEDQTLEQIFEETDMGAISDYVFCKYYSLFIKYKMLVQTNDTELNLKLRMLYEPIVQMLLNTQFWVWTSIPSVRLVPNPNIQLTALVHTYLECIEHTLQTTEIDFEPNIRQQVLDTEFPIQTKVENAEPRQVAQLYVWIVRHLTTKFLQSLFHPDVMDWM